jgi:hypothetical protein
VEPGQRLPDLVLTGLHGRQAAQKLSAYNTTPLIIAFWSPTCEASVASLTRMEALQEKYQGRLQFLVANRQDRDSTLRFFRRQALPATRNYTMISGNKELEAAFPHKYFPWYIWVTREGTVRYITGLNNLTERNIERFLAGEDLPVRNRKDPDNFNADIPLIAEGNGRWLKNIPMYIYAAHCDPDANYINTNGSFNERDSSYRFFAHCSSLRDLLIKAFSENGKYRFNQQGTVRLLVKDSAKYIWPARSDEWDLWRQKNAYSFEMKVPAANWPQAHKIMQHYLVTFFNLDVRVEKKRLPCLVLVRTGKGNKLASKGGPPSANIAMTTTEPVRYIHNHPFEVLVANIRNRCVYHNYPKPFVDGTGYKGNIDIQVNREAFDTLQLPALREELRSYGLDLVEKDWLVDVLVIREKEKE